MDGVFEIEESTLIIYGKKYLVGNQIACGSYGAVFNGTDEHGTDVIMKFMKYRQNLDEVSPIFNELSCLQLLRGEKVVNLLDYALVPKSGLLTPGSCTVLILERSHSDLSKFIEDSRATLPFIPKPDIKRIFKQVLEGIELMHDHLIMHRDLKPSNVLVSSSGLDAKIIDFGFSEQMRFFDKQDLQIQLGKMA